MNCAPLPDVRVEMMKEGGLDKVPGVRGGTAAAGLKPSQALDIAIIDAGCEMHAAGVFTQNKLAAAPVLFCRKQLETRPVARGIVINAGNANAMTGEQGEVDTRAMAEHLERLVAGPALVLSTGVIGVPMPMDKVLAGMDAAAKDLDATGLVDVARAIMTTDTRPKTAAARVVLPAEGNSPQVSITVGGMAKGSGMIHPNMATMLSVIITDAPLTSSACREILSRSVEDSFNCISVDGDTSTNDTVLLLAGGAEMPDIKMGTERQELVEVAIQAVAQELAWQIVCDGEGAKRIARVRVHGAASRKTARQIAEAVSCSSLVKTALAGGDPNWGRILAAAANAGVDLDMSRLKLSLSGILVFDGRPVRVDQTEVDRAFSAKEVDVKLELGQGQAKARMFTTDLTKRYVEINSEYTT